jgi:hypothetical protein
MLLRFVLLLVSIPLLAHGGERLYIAALSRHQAQVSCEDYFRRRPVSRWVRITGCELDYVRAGYRESGGQITELLFPLRPMGTSPALPAAVVVSTRDPQALSIAQQTISRGSNGNQESFLVMMLQIVTTLRASREVEGMTRGRVEMLRTRKALSAIRAPLADDFTILDLRVTPRLLWPAIEAAIGLQALLVFLFLLLTRRRSRRADVSDDGIADTDEPPMRERLSPPEESEPQFHPPVIRGLMLLNLPETATLADVETAPALGSAEEVRSKIGKVLGGIQFNEVGRATYNRPDFSIQFDLGRRDPVHTAVVHLEGDAAARVFGRLLAQTGWRAFAPKRGAFVTVGETLETTNP